MKEHVLKTWTEPFAAILDGRKRYEIRRNDRAFAVGDVLVLREWKPQVDNFACSQCGLTMRRYADFWERQHIDCGGLVVEIVERGYTGRTLHARVTYLTPGGAWGLPDGLCVMSIERLTESISDLVARSSVGAGLANIREAGIEAELAELERETKPRRRRKR